LDEKTAKTSFRFLEMPNTENFVEDDKIQLW